MAVPGQMRRVGGGADARQLPECAFDQRKTILRETWSAAWTSNKPKRPGVCCSREAGMAHQTFGCWLGSRLRGQSGLKAHFLVAVSGLSFNGWPAPVRELPLIRC